MADEPTPDAHDRGQSQHLADRWRADPKALREAVRNAREAYQRTPKAAARLPDASCLIGESKGRTVLYGLVVSGSADEEAVHAELQEIAARVKEATRHREAGIQVFVPPDWSSSGPKSVAGVRVDWFRWVPVSEHEVRVEKLTARSVAASPGADNGVIARLLGHLAWWEQAIRDGTGPETPYRKALLVYNAATLLEWHFTATGKDPREHLQNAKSREKAGEVIREMIEAVQACVEKVEARTEANARKQLATLADAVAKAIKKLAKLYGCDAKPNRIAAFESPLKPAELIAGFLATNAGGARGAQGSDSGTASGGSGNLVLQSLAPALAAERLFDEGKLTAEANTAVRQTCADFLEAAVAIAADRSEGKTKKRWRQVGRPVAEAFRRPVATRSGKGES